MSTKTKLIYRSFAVIVVIALLSQAFNYFSGLRQAQAAVTLDTDFWTADGTVMTIEKTLTTTYVGGSFEYVGPNTGYGAPFDVDDETRFPSFARVNGTIEAVISDGTDGWFIGGSFTEVGGVARNRLAHIEGDGSLDAGWNPNVTGTVKSLALHSGIVYAGGEVSMVGATARDRLAGINATTGALTAFSHTITGGNGNSSVEALEVIGDTLYVGGYFSTIDTVNTRNRIAAFDLTTGNLTAWAVSITGGAFSYVSSIASSGGASIYIGGDFTTAAASGRSNLALLNTGASTVDGTWNPSADNIVRDIEVSGATVYVGGQFANVGGAARNRFASLNNTNGNANILDLAISGSIVLDIEAVGTKLYLGGDFDTVAGQGRMKGAIYDTGTGLETWEINSMGSINAIAADATSVYLGTNWFSVGGARRNNVAAFDNTTLEATAWNPSTDSNVNDIKAVGSSVYLGGSFSEVGGVPREYFAKVDATTGALQGADLGFDSDVYSMDTDGDTLFIGGDFSEVDSEIRNYAAALDIDGFTLTAWDPNADSSIYAVGYNDGLVYLGGDFNTLNDGITERNYIAAVNTTDGVLDSWYPVGGADSVIRDFAFDSINVYVGGEFFEIGGEENPYLAALDITTAALDPDIDPEPDSTVHSVFVSGGGLYFFGEFTNIDSVAETRNYAAALNKLTGELLDWDPDLDSTSYDGIQFNGSQVLIAGEFFSINGFDDEIIGLALVEESDAPSPPPTVEFSAASSSGLESVTSVNLTVEISESIGADVTVDYDVTGGTATGGGVDYTLASGTATVESGDTTTTIPITVVNDDIDEVNQTIQVTLSDPTNATLGSTTVHTYTINDNDTAGITVNPTTADVTEGGATDTYTVVLESQPTDTVTITLTDDVEVDVSSPTLVFTTGNWDDAQTVTVTATNDVEVEGVHVGTVSHTADSTDTNYDGFVIDSVTATITDNDVVSSSSSTYGSTQFLQINKGAARTTNPLVTLRVLNIPSTVKQVRISNFFDFRDSQTILATPEISWNLCSGLVACPSGEYKVYMQFVSTIAGSVTKVYNDSIILEVDGTITSRLGAAIKDGSGTVYTITLENGVVVKRPYTSGAAFLSYGFNSFAKVVDALPGDLSLPTGSFIPPRDGSVICSDRGADKGTCYLITEQKKAGFTSQSVFTGLGFSFGWAEQGDVSWMASTLLVASSTEAHRPGTLINNKGTLQIVGKGALIGIPSMEVLTSWGYNPTRAVIANSMDMGMSQASVLSPKKPEQLSPQY